MSELGTELELELELELEFFLRPTDSRPVRLGIGPPLRPLTRFYLTLLFSADKYLILLSKAYQ
jgi:hypothetical protein